MIANSLIALCYAALLGWVYEFEIHHFWSYMRYEADASLSSLIFCFISVTAASLMLPLKKDSRGYILLTAHYFFVIPSIIYATFNPVETGYIISIAVFTFFVYIGSLYPVRGIHAPGVRPEMLVKVFSALIIFTLAFLALFGGLKNFNLNIEAVYQYRRETAERLPAAFGYIFFNVSNALIPSSIALALYLRSRSLALLGLVSGVLLFAMSHHKAILFTAIAVLILYWLLSKIRNLNSFTIFPGVLVLISFIEILYQIYFATDREPGFITSYIVRRALFTPPMADSASVEIFSEAAKYYWSTSSISFGILQNPHGVTAPFFLATNIFNDPDMSLNSGVIGSGFAQAGIFGVLIYSIFTALTISFVRSVGERVGHSLVSAISMPILLQIFTTADFLTTILTHGLLMLILIMIYLPRVDDDFGAISR